MPVYLDYNATAPLRPFVLEAMSKALALAGNASSIHQFGRAARHTVESARASVATSVGVKPVQVIFTSGGTESNSMALRAQNFNTHLCSTIEHDSVLYAAPAIETIGVDSQGVLDQEDLKNQLKGRKPPFLVSVMLANNETGVLQDMPAIADLVHAAGGILHCDAVQAYGRLPLDFDTLKADMLSLSAHKAGGPKGVGALIVREGLTVAPMIRGGGQERNRRAGTENIPAIAGFGALAEQLPQILKTEPAHMKKLQQQLEVGLSGLTIYSHIAPRLPNTSCIGLAKITAETQILKLDLAGFAVSAGSACSSGKVTPSHVIRAMGYDEAMAARALRISTGWQTTAADIDGFLAAFHT